MVLRKVGSTTGTLAAPVTIPGSVLTSLAILSGHCSARAKSTAPMIGIVLMKPVVTRYHEADIGGFFRGDAALANPDIYTFL